MRRVVSRMAPTLARLFGQQGVAVPMALMSALILSAVVVGFATLSATEPVIAGNQLAVAQARALAEAGIERALWALSNPGDPEGIPLAFTRPPSPYDGSQLVSVRIGARASGGFRVMVTAGATLYERGITAVGWVPDDVGPGPRAAQKITVTALDPQLIAKEPPAALSVRAELRATGALAIDARTDQRCGRKLGVVTGGEAQLTGAGTDVRGGSGDPDARNRITDAAGGAIPQTAGDIVENAGRPALEEFALTDADLDVLRAIAKRRGAYLRGAIRFDASHRMPNGLIFVDTATEVNAGGEGSVATPAAGLAAVEIAEDAAVDPSGVWSGWLVVNGSVSIRGAARMKGLVYAQDALRVGAGRLELSGAMIGRNARDASAMAVDAGASLSITYNCEDMRTGGGAIPGRWTLRAGTYREESGS